MTAAQRHYHGLPPVDALAAELRDQVGDTSRTGQEPEAARALDAIASIRHRHERSAEQPPSVYSQPRTSTGWFGPGGTPYASVAWDLSWGCGLVFGNRGDTLTASVLTVDGDVVRCVVTPEHVRAFAGDLLRLLHRPTSGRTEDDATVAIAWAALNTARDAGAHQHAVDLGRDASRLVAALDGERDRAAHNRAWRQRHDATCVNGPACTTCPPAGTASALPAASDLATPPTATAREDDSTAWVALTPLGQLNAAADTLNDWLAGLDPDDAEGPPSKVLVAIDTALRAGQAAAHRETGRSEGGGADQVATPVSYREPDPSTEHVRTLGAIERRERTRDPTGEHEAGERGG